MIPNLGIHCDNKERAEMAKLGHEEEDDTTENPTDEVVDGGEDQQDAKPAKDESVDVVEAKDERLADQSDKDEDDKDERHRETAKERRARAKAAKQRDKEELELLRTTIAKQNARMEEIEKATVANRVTDLDNRLAVALNEVQTFDDIFGKAITAKNGEDARRASQLRDEAKQRAWALHNEKMQITQAAERPAQSDAPKPYAGKAVSFIKENMPWYNPGAGDEDSLIAQAIDAAVAKSGYDPNSDTYWEELGKRLKKRLPHKFQAQDADDDEDDVEDEKPAPRKGPPTGGSSRTKSNGGRQEIRLPAQMVEAMKEAGYWDDPVKRAKVARRYQEQLRNNAG